MLSPLSGFEGQATQGPSYDAAVLGLAIAWPRSSWGTAPYMAALHGMAGLHAGWWGRVQENGPWPRLPEIYDPEPSISAARSALLSIESEHSARTLLGENRVGTLLSLLDEPSVVLDLLRSAPITLVAPNLEPRNGETYVFAGPAAYDLAAFYTSSRWHYGRTPLGLAETRNAYLSRLGALLDSPVDDCLFDVTVDAARCWSFALGWAETIAARPPALMARAHIFRATVSEPAFASLRRLQRV